MYNQWVKIIAFDNIKTKQSKFHNRRNLILLEDLDIGNILISGMSSSGEKKNKYFTDYKENN